MDHDEDAVTQRTRSNLQLIKGFLPWLAPHKGKLAMAAVLMVLCTALFQAGPLLVRRAVDSDLGHKNLQGLYLTVALFVLAQAAYLVLNYVQRIVLEQVGLRIVTDIKQTLFERTLTLSMAFFDKMPVGRLISRVEADAEALRQLFTFTAVVLLGDSLKLVVSALLMLSIDAKLGAIILSTLAGVVGASIVFERLARPIFREARTRVADVMAFLEEHLQGIAVVQAFRQEGRARRQMDDTNRAKFAVDVRSYLLMNTFWNAIFLLETAGLCLALGIGGMQVLQGVTTLGTLLMFLEFLRRFFEPVWRLTEQVGVIQRAFAAGERVFDMLDETPQVRDPDSGQPWPGLKEGITFDNVSFGYRADEPVLRDVNFTIPRGERWALVGPTGSGKSTIVGLLLRFYDPTSGSVAVDGTDLRCMLQKDVRARTALVLQDNLVFPGTVRENLSLWHDVPQEALESAARRAAAHDFIEGLPQGYDTELFERGGNLSTGQRQLISFARALARDPDLLILDEATASVDPETERAIQAGLHQLLEGRTALIVAHRLSTIRDCDRILVLEKGRIIEQGTHDQLMAREGAYRRLYQTQMPQEVAS